MFRFTIRDVLWLTVVVALALGWFVDNRLTASQRKNEAKSYLTLDPKPHLNSQT